jgi:hypothetical protein
MKPNLTVTMMDTPSEMEAYNLMPGIEMEAPTASDENQPLR